MASKIDTHEMLKPTLLIIKHFYTLKAAEHEVVERLAASTEELGWISRVVEVDANFNFKNINHIEKNVDAVLDIHFEYPKFFSAKSIGAFWTPTSFMKDWDLAYVWENQLSHDNLVHTDSMKTLHLLERFRPNEKFGILNHSLPGSWVDWINLVERSETPRAFYSGINWNKLSGRKGRNHEFFELLDGSDMLNIYGPKKISHVTPWKGFESYRGEIPFDGKSILHRSRESGVSLVLSSEQHLSEGMISSRFFEGLAAGNAIISDDHPFVKKHLGKHGYYLNLDRGDEYASNQFLEFMIELRQDSKILHSRQEFSQELFLEKFNLTHQLRKVLSFKSETKARANMDALILGKPNSDLRGQLSSLGFNRIEKSKVLVQDLKDLISLARSFDLKEFAVFCSKTQVLDGFVSGLKELEKIMKDKNSQFGITTSVALSQDGRRFAPVVMGKTGLIPLNGLIVNLSHKNPIFVSPSKKIPLLRVWNVSELLYITEFHDSYSFLKGLTKGSSESANLPIRKLVNSEFDKKYTQSQRDLIEEIRLMPRARRLILVYSLVAALPFVRYFATFVKWFIRNKPFSSYK